MAVDQHKGIYKPCCLSKGSDWDQSTNIELYWQSDRLKLLRKRLLSGERDPNCQRCWYLEDKGLVSMRQSVAQSRSADTINPCITQVKLITGNLCNAGCMMCFSSVSSRYAQIWQNRDDWIMPDAKLHLLEYDQIMDDYIRQNADKLKYIEVLGGEPLLEKRYHRLLEYLVSIGANQHLTVFTVTNGSILNTSLIQLFQKFKKAVFAVSIDGIGLVNDYQRWPTKWSKISQNLEILNQHFDVSILPTVTALNIIGLPRLVDYCENRGYVINNMNIVDYWPQLKACNLPPDLQCQVSDQYRGLLDGNSDTQSLLDFIRQWDTQRKIRIWDYMPEWRTFF